MFSNSDREFLKKIDFSQTDINDAKLLDLMKLPARDKDVYSQHKYDVGEIKQKFHVKLLPNSTLTKQRPSRVPLHHQEKLEILLDQLCKAGIIREMGDDTEMGSSFINPVIILPRRNIVKLIIDARYLNSITAPKQKAHQYLIETPNATWEQLKNQVSTKDISFAVSSDFTGTASSSIDNKMEIDGIKDQLQELASLMKNNRISAA